MFVRKQEISLEFQPYIDFPPVSTKALYEQACTGDTSSIEHWRKEWIENAKVNKDKFGSFGLSSVGDLFQWMACRPCIIAGSGPSLRHNISALKHRPNGMGLVSCLHNFHAMEDAEAGVDYYVSLDAGPVTIEEVTEGGSKTADEYWAMTKDRTLIAFIASNPELLRKWQGPIKFFRCPIPDVEIDKAHDEIESFHSYVSCGGNVLGACLYIAKVYLGANPIVFVGADFSFGYDRSEKTGSLRSHAWDSKYDATLGQVMRVTDVFGNKVPTWPSYWNFKCFFDRTAIDVPGLWINATEGGIFGAYPDGNIRAIQQMTLAKVYEMYSLSNMFEGQALRPSELDKRVCF